VRQRELASFRPSFRQRSVPRLGQCASPAYGSTTRFSGFPWARKPTGFSWAGKPTDRGRGSGQLDGDGTSPENWRLESCIVRDRDYHRWSGARSVAVHGDNAAPRGGAIEPDPPPCPWDRRWPAPNLTSSPTGQRLTGPAGVEKRDRCQAGRHQRVRLSIDLVGLPIRTRGGISEPLWQNGHRGREPLDWRRDAAVEISACGSRQEIGGEGAGREGLGARGWARARGYANTWRCTGSTFQRLTFGGCVIQAPQLEQGRRDRCRSCMPGGTRFRWRAVRASTSTRPLYVAATTLTHGRIVRRPLVGWAGG
jgi:hypothetical protein